MFRELGHLIWTHTRDMTVLNFPKALVYEIYTNEGYTYIRYCKETKMMTVENCRPTIRAELYSPANIDAYTPPKLS